MHLPIMEFPLYKHSRFIYSFSKYGSIYFIKIQQHCKKSILIFKHILNLITPPPTKTPVLSVMIFRRQLYSLC